MAVRVLRLLEYTYDDAETAEKDMARWTHSYVSKTGTMKSAVLPFSVMDADVIQLDEVEHALEDEGPCPIERGRLLFAYQALGFGQRLRVMELMGIDVEEIVALPHWTQLRAVIDKVMSDEYTDTGRSNFLDLCERTLES